MPRDKTTEALDVLADLTRTDRDVILSADKLLRRKKDASAAFVLGWGLQSREIKRRYRFDTDQLARWADDGGRA